MFGLIFLVEGLLKDTVVPSVCIYLVHAYAYHWFRSANIFCLISDFILFSFHLIVLVIELPISACQSLLYVTAHLYNDLWSFYA